MMKNGSRVQFKASLQTYLNQFLQKATMLYQSYQINIHWNKSILSNIILKSLFQQYTHSQEDTEFFQTELIDILNKSDHQNSLKFNFDKPLQVSISHGHSYEQSQQNYHYSNLSNINQHPNCSTNPICHFRSRQNQIFQENQQSLPQPIPKDTLSEDIGLNQFKNKPKKKKYAVYTPEQKQKAVKLGLKSGILAASRQLNIPPKNIQRWIKKDDILVENRGRKPKNPQMEKDLSNWILQNLSLHKELTQRKIRAKAIKLANDGGKFKASKGWLEKYYRRNVIISNAINKAHERMYSKGKLHKQTQEQISFHPHQRVAQKTQKIFHRSNHKHYHRLAVKSMEKKRQDPIEEERQPEIGLNINSDNKVRCIEKNCKREVKEGIDFKIKQQINQLLNQQGNLQVKIEEQ